MKILDIGCGKNKIKGMKGDIVIGLDSKKLKGVDIVWNLEKTLLPFKNNYFNQLLKLKVEELKWTKSKIFHFNYQKA